MPFVIKFTKPFVLPETGGLTMKITNNDDWERTIEIMVGPSGAVLAIPIHTSLKCYHMNPYMVKAHKFKVIPESDRDKELLVNFGFSDVIQEEE